MPVDVRVNNVTSRVNAVDAEALLSAPVLERIVAAVRERLALERAAARDEDLDKEVRDRAVRID